MMFEKFSILKFWGDRIGSTNSSLKQNSIIQAHWVATGGHIDPSCNDCHPGIVEFFFQQSIPMENSVITLIVAKVNWYELHPERHLIEPPFEQWMPNAFEPLGPASFIPAVRIKAICCSSTSSCKSSYDEQLIAICPLIQKIHF